MFTPQQQKAARTLVQLKRLKPAEAAKVALWALDCFKREYLDTPRPHADVHQAFSEGFTLADGKGCFPEHLARNCVYVLNLTGDTETIMAANEILKAIDDFEGFRPLFAHPSRDFSGLPPARASYLQRQLSQIELAERKLVEYLEERLRTRLLIATAEAELDAQAGQQNAGRQQQRGVGSKEKVPTDTLWPRFWGKAQKLRTVCQHLSKTLGWSEREIYNWSEAEGVDWSEGQMQVDGRTKIVAKKHVLKTLRAREQAGCLFKQ